MLFNLVDHGAAVKVSLSGSPAFTLQSSPYQLVARGQQPAVGSQDIVVRFVAPTPRGSHHGNVRVDLTWAGGTKPETLNIPVVGHSLLSHESTDDEIAVRKREKSESDARAKHVKKANDELAAFDRAHPGFTHNGFDDKKLLLGNAMQYVIDQQKVGLARAHDEITKYAKAPPRPEKDLFTEIAMIVLDVASAGLANAVAKAVEGGLKAVAARAAEKVADPITGKLASAAGALVLGESTIYGISDGVKEALKIASKRARPLPGAEKPAQTPSDDPRLAFIETIQASHNVATLNRKDAMVGTLALLRPTLYKNPDVAIKSVVEITQQLIKEGQAHASHDYYQAAMHTWFAFISELRLGANRVGSADGKPITPIRGVVDIGFQVSGRSPRDRVTPKTAIMRGVSNAAIKDLKTASLLHTYVPIRVYGMPSPGHAELLVTVTRDSLGQIQFLDQTNGAAPGNGAWLKNRGGGDAERGAEWLLRDLLTESLDAQGVTLMTDQDPTLPGG